MFCAQVQSCYPSFSTTMFEPNHIARKLSNTCDGVGQQRVPEDFVRREPIPVPPICEQRRIVDILDQADRLRLLRIEANAKADRILHALFINMFGNPPTSWTVGRLADLLRPKKGALQSGPFGSHLHNHDFVRSGTVLAVGIDNVLDGEFVPGRDRRITREKHEELRKYTLEPGDVLITIMGTVGRTCVFRASNIVRQSAQSMCTGSRSTDRSILNT